MKHISNKTSAKLFFIALVCGLSAYAILWYMAEGIIREKELRAVKTCKEKYEQQLPDFTLTFKDMTPHHTNDYEFTVTGTITYVDEKGEHQEIRHLACQSVFG